MKSLGRPSKIKELQGKSFAMKRWQERSTGPWVSGALAFTPQCLFFELFAISIMYSKQLNQIELGSDLKTIADLPIQLQGTNLTFRLHTV